MISSEAETVVAAVTELLREICEMPAPTFEEGERARLIERRFRGMGLEPEIDAAGNVVARLPGGTGPRLLVAAHLDTVFPAGTDVRVRRSGGRLRAPGIGDNSASLAVMLHAAERALADPERRRPRLTLAATVGEEGLGDLAGARRLVADRGAEHDLFVALDGHLGTIVTEAVGSRRYEVRFRAAGGHSWGDYPSPSATHALGEAIHALNRMKVPREPRSSCNVGQVHGGTSVNAIAQEAGFNLDLRSLDAAALDALDRDALGRIRRAARRAGVEVEVERVGDRPVARVDNRALARAARAALRRAGCPARAAASSTDANAALAAGLPSIAFGVYRGGDAHRASEWLEPSSLAVGLEAFEALLEELAEPEG